jgi:hypothetical protein
MSGILQITLMMITMVADLYLRCHTVENENNQTISVEVVFDEAQEVAPLDSDTD